VSVPGSAVYKPTSADAHPIAPLCGSPRSGLYQIIAQQNHVSLIVSEIDFVSHPSIVITRCRIHAKFAYVKSCQQSSTAIAIRLCYGPALVRLFLLCAVTYVTYLLLGNPRTLCRQDLTKVKDITAIAGEYLRRSKEQCPKESSTAGIQASITLRSEEISCT
jgi:hypothetical protein